ncbi:DNA phosphorothioation-associated putative methyltransferase [Pseudoalteromonas xiamenensis]
MPWFKYQCVGPSTQTNGVLEKRDIVNLGFVLNVIENIDERAVTLQKAYSYAEKLLVVSVMLLNNAVLENYKPFKDGVITKRNTFQKYYTQTQIKEFIEDVLQTKATPIGQGIIAVFKSQALFEKHKLDLQFNQFEWCHLTQRPTPRALTTSTKTVFDKHPVLLEQFWQHCLHYGRIPANEEFEQSDQIRRVFGSHKKAFEIVQQHFDENAFTQAQHKRKADLLVYFALSLFEKRQVKSHLPNQIQRDIKYHFNTFETALDQANTLLYSIANPVEIGRLCHEVYENLKLGEFNDSHSYTLPRQHIHTLPALLRIYVGAAAQLYGDIDDVDLIKIHMRSGKVTLLKYDDYAKKLPLLVERVKVKLAQQDIDYFYYGNEYPLQPLYNKADFLAKTTPEHSAQQRFNAKMAGMLKGVPQEEWPNWDILQKVFDYWGVKLINNKFYTKSSSNS